MAATPQTPGWALASIYYHTSVAASGAVGLSREISIGKFNPTFNINININASVSGTGDLGILAPSYVFATPFFGGQASATLVGIYGRNDTALNATATVTPGPLTKSVALEQNSIAFGDMIP